ELQRSLPRRVPLTRMVPQPLRSSASHRDVAQALQRSTPPFEFGVSHSQGIQEEARGRDPERGNFNVIGGPETPGTSRSLFLGSTYFFRIRWRAAKLSVQGPAELTSHEGSLAHAR